MVLGKSPCPQPPQLLTASKNDTRFKSNTKYVISLYEFKSVTLSISNLSITFVYRKKMFSWSESECSRRLLGPWKSVHPLVLLD